MINIHIVILNKINTEHKVQKCASAKGHKDTCMKLQNTCIHTQKDLFANTKHIVTHIDTYKHIGGLQKTHIKQLIEQESHLNVIISN